MCKLYTNIKLKSTVEYDNMRLKEIFSSKIMNFLKNRIIYTEKNSRTSATRLLICV